MEAFDGVPVRRSTLDHFKALALHRLGRHDEALTILEQASAAAGGHTLFVPDEEQVGLRLDIRAALGRDNTATLTAAEALLRTAPPLLALRLGRAVASALGVAGETRRADAQDAAARALAHRLAASLQDEPELGTCFSASYGESRAASNAA
jgi:hypothetical protein